MYSQNDPRAPYDFQKYACLFSVLAYARKVIRGIDWTIGEAIYVWSLCRALGIITGDLNGDGDYDDVGEDEIDSRRYADLFKQLNVPLVYRDQTLFGLPMGPDANGTDRILPVSSQLDPSRFWVAEAWRWKYLHFVKGDGTGRKPVEYDSLDGGSYSVMYGKCESIRVFEIDKGAI